MTPLPQSSRYSRVGPSAAGHRYAPVMIALHWTTALTIVALVLLVVGRELLDSPALGRALLQAHRALGPLVLLLVVARLAARALTGAPVHAGQSAHTRRVAAAAHGILYLLLFAVPLIGWAGSNAEGKTISLFGLLPLPNLVGVNEDLGDFLGDAHGFAAWTLLALIGLHAAAALWHHFVRRDDVLTAMLPGRASGEGRS